MKSNRKLKIEPNGNITCEDVLGWIDSREKLGVQEQVMLDRHIKNCPSCKEALRIESVVRRIIVPEKLPSPSSNFEASLMAELGIEPAYESRRQPVIVKAEAPARYFDPITLWGSILGFISLIFVLLPQISKLFSAIETESESAIEEVSLLTTMGNTTIAHLLGLIGRLQGDIAFIQGQFSYSTGLNVAMTFNLLMGSLILLGGFLALRISMKD